MEHGVLSLIHGDLSLPIFLPDATRGVVRTVDTADLEQAGVQALVMNVFHLMQKPGSSTIQALGGLHAMTDWPRPIMTDSGGFQIYSLIRREPSRGTLTVKSMSFRPAGASRKYRLTPDKSIQLQLAYGADVVMCLDDCTHSEAPQADQRAAVERTITWARQCKQAFTRQIEQRGRQDGSRPLILGVIQGGADLDLRRRCADTLLDIGFDGYGFGGWPLDGEGRLREDLLAATRSFIPERYPMHALGVGYPDSIVTCTALGYSLFDSALPTRDARRGRLYAFTTDPVSIGFDIRRAWWTTRYMQDKKYIKENTPLSPYCDCHTCSKYTLGYLHHLFTSNETLFYRLATIHNLRFMMRLMETLRR